MSCIGSALDNQSLQSPLLLARYSYSASACRQLWPTPRGVRSDPTSRETSLNINIVYEYHKMPVTLVGPRGQREQTNCSTHLLFYYGTLPLGIAIFLHCLL